MKNQKGVCFENMNLNKMLEFKKMKDDFEQNHPMMPKYLKKIKEVGLEVDDVVEIVVKKKNGEVYPANIKINEADLESFREIF